MFFLNVTSNIHLYLFYVIIYISRILSTYMFCPLLCVQESSNDRPSVLEVSSLLNSETTDIMIPNKPDFSKQIDAEYQQNKHTNSSKINSVNDVTVSELFGR
ncbi:hypothetical protein ACOSP7_012435 [Xanthoceras sorbifolium]